MNLSMLVDIYPYTWHAIGSSIFCGAIIGLERQIKGKPVGIRTASLITLGTYLYLATVFLLDSSHVDPSRVIGQVITGIGFLGAGVMLAKEGIVVGVTSAATIWVLASVGVVIATDHLLVAIKLSILVVVILYGVDMLEEHVKSLGRGVHAHVKRYSSRIKNDRL
tara:strand:+ start:42416 stop:42910 length:495 start_codon:yes stop_codon:yes gene_type:complete